MRRSFFLDDLIDTVKDWMEILWEWVKPILQAFGIFLIGGCFLLYIRKNPTDFEAVLVLFVIPIAYIALRWFWLIQEARRPAKEAQKTAQKRQDLLARFNNSKECHQYLSLVKQFQPASIHLTHTQPPSEKHAPRHFNRLYPEAKSFPPLPFPPASR